MVLMVFVSFIICIMFHANKLNFKEKKSNCMKFTTQCSFKSFKYKKTNLHVSTIMLPAHFDDVTDDISRLIKPNLVKNTTGAL